MQKSADLLGLSDLSVTFELSRRRLTMAGAACDGSLQEDAIGERPERKWIMRARRGRGERKWGVGFAGSVAVLFVVVGCHVVPNRSDEMAVARDHPSFDAQAWLSSGWNGRISTSYRQQEVPAGALVAMLRSQPAQATARYGRRSGDDAAWAFVTRGEGSIRSIDRRSRAGSAVIVLDGGQILTVQIGPVVTGTALRDALPFVRFNDFPDQMAFAEVNKALNARSLAEIAPDIEALRPGDRVRFAGALLWRANDDGLLITPIELRRAGGDA